MNLTYNVVDEMRKLFYQDSMWFGAILFPILILCGIIGVYVYFKVEKQNPSYCLFKLWFWGVIISSVVVGIGYSICYMQFKNEVSQYSSWLAAKEYVVIIGAVEKVERSSNPLCESFVIKDQLFDTNKNPCLLGRQDILNTGKILSITSHEGIILLISQPEPGAQGKS